MIEEWRNIKGVHSDYLVSNTGRVKSVNKKWSKRDIKIVKPFLNTGYNRVAIKNNIGDRKKYLVHRLVAMAFLSKKDHHTQVNHIDGDKLNNNLNNLEWVTSSENIKHAIKNGLLSHKHNEGSKNHMSRLDDIQVLTIRTMHDSDLKDYAESLGVRIGTVRNAREGVTFKSLPNPIKREKNPAAKLKEMDILHIRNMLKDGLTHREIASKFNVHQSCISKIATGRRWKNARL